MTRVVLEDNVGKISSTQKEDYVRISLLWDQKYAKCILERKGREWIDTGRQKSKVRDQTYRA